MSITSISPRGGYGANGSGLILAPVTGLPAEKDFSLPFQHRLTLPKSTLQSAPYEYDMKLPIGIIRRLWIETPAGCKGLVGIQIWRSVYQIFPLPDGQWFVSDNTTISFAFSHSIHNEPYEVTIKAYNLDDTFQHKPWIAFEMTGQSSEISPQLQGLIDYVSGKSGV